MPRALADGSRKASSVSSLKDLETDEAKLFRPIDVDTAPAAPPSPESPTLTIVSTGTVEVRAATERERKAQERKEERQRRKDERTRQKAVKKEEKRKLAEQRRSNETPAPNRVNFFRRRSNSAPRQRQRPAETRIEAFQNRAKGRIAGGLVGRAGDGSHNQSIDSSIT